MLVDSSVRETLLQCAFGKPISVIQSPVSERGWRSYNDAPVCQEMRGELSTDPSMSLPSAHPPPANLYERKNGRPYCYPEKFIRLIQGLSLKLMKPSHVHEGFKGRFDPI